MFKNLLSILLMINLIGWGFSFTIQPVNFELLEKSFRLSIPSDPDMKWVSFHVNINKPFKSFETGQLIGEVRIPVDKKWTYEFKRELQDQDIVYVWLAVQHNRLIFRDKQEPISVEAFKSGNTMFRITTTTESSAKTPTVGTTKPGDVNLGTKICRPTATIVPQTYGGRFCRDDLIFSDNFDTLNTQYWTNEIRFPSTVDDAEFVLYNGTLGVEEGLLKIEASLNQLNVKKDTIDLGGRCTSLSVAECILNPRNVLILPPIISGSLTTRNYFKFKYGRIEVRAKLPMGDWLFPSISLKPSSPIYGEHYRSGEMRVAFARGNHYLKWNDQNINGNRLYGGVILNSDADHRHQFMKDTTLSNNEHYGNDFHLYTLIWKPDELIMMVDGNEYGRVKTNFKEIVNEAIWNKGERNAPLDQFFYINLALAAGGNGDFPNTDGKPWGNTDPRGSLNFYRSRNAWFPTWSQPSLEVDYIKVYAI